MACVRAQSHQFCDKGLKLSSIGHVGSILTRALLRRLPFVILLGVLQPDPSIAVTLSPPFVETAVGVTPGLLTRYGGLGSLSFSAADYAVEAAAMIPNGAPTVSEQVALNGPADAQASASSQLSWQFYIAGPPGNVIVPTIIEGSAMTSTTGGGFADSEIVLHEEGHPDLDRTLLSIICDPGCSHSGPPFTVGELFGFYVEVSSNSLYDLLITTNGTTTVGGTTMSEIDPTIAILPWFPDANLYTHIQNLEVPEPSQMTLIGVGLAAMGLSRRPVA